MLTPNALEYSKQPVELVISLDVTMYQYQWLSLLHNFIHLSLSLGTQVLRYVQTLLAACRSLRWWGSLTMVPAGNNAKRISSVSHTTKTIIIIIIIIIIIVTSRNSVLSWQVKILVCDKGKYCRWVCVTSKLECTAEISYLKYWLTGSDANWYNLVSNRN